MSRTSLALVPREAPAAEPRERPWSLGAMLGRLVELSGTRGAPLLTVAMSLVREAQERDGASSSVAWVGLRDSSFYPPDAAAAGVALDRLVVVRAAESKQIPRAAIQLVRSSAYALVVIDLVADGGKGSDLSLPAQTRLNGLAQKHGSAVLCLTRKAEEAGSLGSLVSLRAHASRRALGNGLYACELSIVKDKRRGPGWRQGSEHHGPEGLV